MSIDVETMKLKRMIDKRSPEHVATEIQGQGIKRAWIVGGGKLAASFRERGLITAYGIGIVPSILGGGIPLLAPKGALDKLALTGCQTYPDGVVMLWYRKSESRSGVAANPAVM